MAKIYNDFQSANLMSFAKSFARLNGQPLDKSEIWYSLEEAQAYAATDAAYVGQILAVIDVDNNKVAFYGIQNSNGELTEVGSGNIDEVISAIEDKIGSAATDTAEATGLFKDIADILDLLDEKADIKDFYTKDEIDNAISSAVAGADHLKRIIKNSLDEIDVNAEDAHLYIYMVPTGLQQEDDKYDEYIVLDGAIEKVGSWEVDLSNYATKTEVNNKIDKDENARLITLTEADKLSNIEANAQVNKIDTVEDDYFSLENKHLNLKDLPISKITNLQNTLNNKVTAQEGYTLLSPDDQKKLSALVIGDDNNLELSANVNADNVQGLAEWLTKNAGTVIGLSEKNFTEDFYDKLSTSLYISDVNATELQVSTEGKLSIVAVDKSKITGLEDALNTKANQSVVNDLSTSVVNIANSLNNYVTKESYNADIQEIRDILTWKEMG